MVYLQQCCNDLKFHLSIVCKQHRRNMRTVALTFKRSIIIAIRFASTVIIISTAHISKIVFSLY